MGSLGLINGHDYYLPWGKVQGKELGCLLTEIHLDIGISHRTSSVSLLAEDHMVIDVKVSGLGELKSEEINAMPGLA